MKRSECYLDCGGNSGVVDLPKTTIFRLMGTPSCDPLVAGAQSASVASVSTAAPLPQRPDCDATPLHFLDTNGRAGEFGDDGQMEDELFSQFSDTVSGDAASGTDQFFWSGDESGTETASAAVDGDHEVHAHNSLPPQDLLALTVNFTIEFGLPWNVVEALQKLITCYSYVCRIGGEQPLSLGQGCLYISTMMLELLHALGFHERTRPDRGNYVDVK
ncbi:hypothetical protein HPB49_025731 [Dermacentor silvarum]|nr:hypothetical protein HPB49_025731 [Dermacentor silvarum]